MKEHTIHVPLIGVEMEVPFAQVGRVVLKNMEKEQLDQLAQQIESLVRESDEASQEVEGLVSAQLPQMLESFNASVCAEIRISGDPERAKKEAEATCRRVLDLLRYSIPVLYPNHLDLDIVIGIRGDILPSTPAHTALVISSDGGKSSWHWQAEDTRTSFVISADSLKIMERLGVLEVGQILDKPELQWNDFESTLLDAIHWFANAQMEIEIAYRLLSLITCLETFLTPQDGNPIGAAIAEGTAIIVGTDLEERKALKKRVHKLYQMRSAITHGGRKEVPEEQVAELTGIAQALIGQMIKRRAEFEDRDALLEWILDQKLSPAGKP
ncbi:MAG TPA: hypothetical protein VF826_14555 [Chloroflexia bacterium]|jgi:hypothetical protein